MKKLSALFTVLLVSLATFVNGQTTKTVGATGADYATLGLAFDAINAGTVAGAITLQLIDNTTELSTARLNASGSGSANYTSVVIYPTISGITITGSIVAPIIDLNGADNVTIDGRVNLSGSVADLIISNTNTGSHASALRFISSAQTNTIKHCNIQSSCYNAGVGMVTFTSSTTGSGNDNNTIEDCNITNAGGNRPICAIFSSGSTGRENSGNIIRNNNIYDFFSPDATSYGIILSFNTTDWTISGNSFYDTETIAPTGSFRYYPLFINTGTHTISNNYIGGSEPLCNGSAWTINSSKPHYFCGVFINGTVTNASTVDNNTIKNVNYTSTEDNPWDGIFINSGIVNVTGNTIGATEGQGSVTVTTPVASATAVISGGVVTGVLLNGGGMGYTTAPPITFSVSGSTTPAIATANLTGGVVTSITLVSGGSGYTAPPNVIFDGQTTAYSTTHGMIKASNATVNITDNNIGSITLIGSDTYSHGFESIYIRGVAGLVTISNNLIGSLVTPNSIITSSSASSSLQKQDCYGIYSSGTGTTIISDNTVANLHNAYSGVSSGARARGILTSGGSNTIQNNTVRNISGASRQTSFGSSASVIGIAQLSATAGTTQTVTGNTVYDLSNTHTTAARVDLYGMYYAGPAEGAHEVSGNFVHGLSVSSTNVGSSIDGIVLNSGAVITCANNIVNLGEGSTPGYLITGIWDGTLAGHTVNIYSNTVYIGGTVTSGVTSVTSAINNANNTSIRNYRNNVLYNARTGGTTGKHYAIIIAGVAGLTIDYNDYFVSGAVLGRIGTLDRADLTAWQTGTLQDLNSLSINPGFTLEGGTDALDYYTSASLPGVSGTGITTDYAGNARAATPKMGALEASNYTWEGTISTDFATAGNWAGGAVPPEGADISFSATPANHCVLDGARTLKDITNTQSDYDLIVNGNQLSISGNLVFSGGAQIDATSASSVVIFAGTTAQSIPSGAFVNNTVDGLTINNSNGLTLLGTAGLTITQALTLTNGAYDIGENTLTLNGAISTTAGTLTGGSSTNIIISGSGATTTLPAVLLNNLTINRANGIILGGAVSVGGTLALTNGTLSLGANLLTISGNSPTRANGFIDAGNESATLSFTNTTAITLPESIFMGAVNNLTINGAGGISALSDFAVNGVLNLQSSNASATKGSLDMWDGTAMKTLTMGANATTTGVGDVTGIIRRTTINPEINYTFGNTYTSIIFPDYGTLPTEISLKVKLGNAPSWRPGAIFREQEVIQTGGSGTKAIMYSHYLDAELNGNDEGKLVFWVGLPTNLEYGRSAYNTTENWVSISNVNMAFFSSSWDETKNVTLDEYSTTTTLTWNGSLSDSWTSIENWTPNVGPASNRDIYIPDAATTPNDPTLPGFSEIHSLTIETGGILNGGDASQLTINGINGAWSNVGGTFNPNTSNIIFTDPFATISGTTNFYNVTIPDGGGLVPGNNNIMRIANSLTVVGTGVLRASFSPNTIEYNGSDQTVINPNGLTPGYYNLILSGSGIKTMPGDALSVANDFTISGTASTEANASMTIGGDLTIEEGTAFTPGNYNHTVGGDYINNGTFTTTAGNTITMNGALAQLITGTGTTEFTNLTIDNSNGVTLLVDEIVNNILSLTNGNLMVGTTNLEINGTISKTSGYLEVSPLSSLSFGGADALTLTNDLFATAPALNNLTINRSGGVTLGNQNMTVNGVLDLSSGTLSLAANTLTIAGSSPTRTSGNIDVSNAAATLAFTNTSAIILPASVFAGAVNNLTLNGTGGVTAITDFTVNGVLNLQSVNPSAIKGSLDMLDGSTIRTLTMGADATTAGPGDVTGIVKRTSFIANTHYSFGNQFTTVTFASGGTYPSQIETKISIGVSPAWKTTAINRLYDFVQTGGSGCIATIATHYLDSELNGNVENELVQCTNGTPGPPLGFFEWGKSNSSSIDNWVAIANVGIGYFPSGFGQLENTLAMSELPSYTWNGSQSTLWGTIENWTPTGTPSSASNVIIPDASTTLNSPTLPASTEIKSLNIDAAGVLNSVSGEQLTINGSNNAWSNVGGTFNAGSSSVIFSNATATLSGTTNFYDITLNSGSGLTVVSGAVLTITAGGTIDVQSGASLTIDADADLTVAGTLTNNGTLNLSGGITASATTTIEGDGSYYVGGNWVNNGTFIPGTGSVTFNGAVVQTISGSSLTTFNDLIIDGTSAGTTIAPGARVTVSGSTFNANGKLTIDSDAPDNNGSLIYNGSGTPSGNVTYNRILRPDANYGDRHFFSSPVYGQTLSGFTSTNNSKIVNDGTIYQIWEYQETDGSWPIVSAVNFVSGKGYNVDQTAESNGLLSFTGTVVNSATMPTTSPYKEGYTDRSTPEAYGLNNTGADIWAPGRSWVLYGGGGWNLLGNPFTSAMDVTGFVSANSAPLNKFDPHYQALYVYDGRTNEYKYAATEIPGPIYAESGFFGENIQAGQGFFVLALYNNLVFNFTPAMQVHNSGVTLLKSAATEEAWPGLQLKVMHGEKESATVIVFNENMTTGLDPGYDVGQMSTGPDVEIYTSMVLKDNSVNFARQALPLADCDKNIIPVGIDTEKGGEVIFSALAVPLDNYKFWLEDRKTGIFTDLNVNTYTVSVPAQTYGTGRFFIYASLNTPTGIDSPDVDHSQDIRIWNSGDKVIIKGDVSERAICEVYDMQGQKVMMTNLTDGELNIVDLFAVSRGVFLVRVVDGLKVYTRKIVLLK